MADPADDRQSRRLILYIGLACMASALASRSFDPLVGVLATEFATDAANIALLSTAFALPYALVQPVLGPLGDVAGKRRTIRYSMFLLAVALALSAMATDLTVLTLLRILAGVAAGGIFPLAIASVGDNVPMAGRQLALTRILVAGLTGQACGGLIAALLEPVVGWRGVILICAASALAGIPFLRDRPGLREPKARALNVGEIVARYRHILSQRAALVLYGAVFIEGALIFGVFPFIAPILSQRGLGGSREAGFAIAAFAVGGFAFAASAGPLLRRVGQNRLVQLGGAAAALGLLAQAVAPTAWLMIAGCLLIGVGFYMMHSAIQTRVTEVAPMARGSAVALHAFSFFLGQSLGPAAMGLGHAVVGAGPSLMIAAAGVLVLGFWLGLRR